ncbi:MAG: uncharacterized protein PWP31_1743 [Clostridia bacterium]|nr:uncharacterized protein [Clostridia bacterium]
MKILNKSNGILIADKIKVANTFVSRLKGLLGYKNLQEGEGLVLFPCSAIHCYGMKFKIDVLFLDENKKVIGIKKGLGPGSTASIKKAKYVVELKEGAINKKNIKIGDFLAFRNGDS